MTDRGLKYQLERLFTNLREGTLYLKKVVLPSSGLIIGETQLHAKKDANGNIDPYWKRTDGTEMNLTGEVKFCRATSALTLTTTAQSITGDGDSSKVRLLLPTIGEWLITGCCDFEITTADPDECIGELFVNDSGTQESGAILFGKGQANRGTISQQWPVTTTAANTPVELKVRKLTDAGTAKVWDEHTTLSATIGAGGGSAVETTDHGSLGGLGDDDHTIYLRTTGARAGSTSQAQDFGSNGIKADVIAESTPDTGVTVDSVVLKDGDITLVAKTANTVFAGPATGGAATGVPAFRDLVPADMPSGTDSLVWVVDSDSQHSKIGFIGQLAGYADFIHYLRANQALTATRYATFQDADGTVAYTADLHDESHTIDSHPGTTLVVGEYVKVTTDGLETGPTGTANRNLVRVDDEDGAEEGELLRWTEDGVEAVTAVEFLQYLSGKADEPFDWNDQEVRNVRKLFIGNDKVDARWHHDITVEDPAADDVIPIIHFFEGRAAVQDVIDGTIGSSTTADYNLEWRATLNGTGTDVFASDVQASTTDTHRKAADFNAPQSDGSGGWLVLAISAVSGTAPDFLAVSLRGNYAP